MAAPTTTVDPEDLRINPEIGLPHGEGPFPVVILVHGGGWVGGNPGGIRQLARFLTDEGYLTINTDYTLANDEPGFPGAIEDVACAVRLGQTHPLGAGPVTLIGHSAGAHIASVVALTGDRYLGGCPIEASGVPGRFVGLSGPYDVDRLGLVMLPFFGGGSQVEPDAWFAGNPHNHVDANPDLEALLLHGDADGIVDIDFTFNFQSDLATAGANALVEVVEGGGHFDTIDPDLVGQLIAAWLER